MSSSGNERHADPITAVTVMPERRRPGRAEHVDPALLPLLRGEFDARLHRDEALAADYEDDPDPLSAARGISVALLMSALLWAGIIATIRLAMG